MKLLASVSLLSALTLCTVAQSADVAPAINQFGLDLLGAGTATNSPGNLVLSPFSVESALAMAWTGASGVTREEMRRVLHLVGDEAAIVDGFGTLARDLRGLQAASRERVESAGRRGVPRLPIELDMANRLFAQSGFALQPDFTRGLRDRFGSPLEELDFLHAAGPARLSINDWVTRETHGRIRELIPSGALNERTRLVLANAVYLRASWMVPFDPNLTLLKPFWADGRTQTKVPTMMQQKHYHYEKRDGFVALALPYEGGELQFLILLPDRRDGLAELERAVTPAMLAACARLPRGDVLLFLPKLKLAPPGMSLGTSLRGLGMTTAFDQPAGSADFTRVAPRKADGYLALTDVLHQASLSVDEDGTEAAAATAVTMMALGMQAGELVPPIEGHIDHPFLFAVQHVASGTCLFLGRVNDPR
jgi:serpin B